MLRINNHNLFEFSPIVEKERKFENPYPKGIRFRNHLWKKERYLSPLLYEMAVISSKTEDKRLR